MDLVVSSSASTKRIKKKGFMYQLRHHWPLFLMLMPGALMLIISNYIPMFGVVIDFKRYRFRGTVWISLVKSEWVGLKNFEFFMKTP